MLNKVNRSDTNYVRAVYEKSISCEADCQFTQAIKHCEEGLAIGPQVEMYQGKSRQEPVDMDFGHVEERKLEVMIPEGYKVSNLNDLKLTRLIRTTVN
ncbi:hypothetical protein AB6735_06995 [Mucilaginibacter sp. RCC_168]|uniref:hypothetical protein n=1 Tax=Mucilaginibacter sp. RCC_168 TaxID=3239221 RepID=UPI00352407C7